MADTCETLGGPASVKRTLIGGIFRMTRGHVRNRQAASIHVIKGRGPVVTDGRVLLWRRSEKLRVKRRDRERGAGAE